MNESRGNDPRLVPDFVGKMVRLLEAKARAAGVTREAYLDGMINGTYPQIHSREIDEFALDDEDGEAA